MKFRVTRTVAADGTQSTSIVDAADVNAAIQAFAAANETPLVVGDTYQVAARVTVGISLTDA